MKFWILSAAAIALSSTAIAEEDSAKVVTDQLLVRLIEKPVVIPSDVAREMTRDACADLRSDNILCQSEAVATGACKLLGFDATAGFKSNDTIIAMMGAEDPAISSLSCRTIAHPPEPKECINTAGEGNIGILLCSDMEIVREDESVE